MTKDYTAHPVCELGIGIAGDVVEQGGCCSTSCVVTSRFLNRLYVYSMF